MKSYYNIVYKMSSKIMFVTSTAALIILGCALLIRADVSHLPLAGAQTSIDPPVTEVCLGCICEAISGCNRTAKCEGDTCGLFKITWAYWSDAGKPTYQGEPQDTATAYANCVNDPFCAARAVQNYMAKFGQDCNEDGVINCYDHAAIHLLGGYGCGGPLNVKYYKKLTTCLDTVQSLTGK